MCHFLFYFTILDINYCTSAGCHKGVLSEEKLPQPCTSRISLTILHCVLMAKQANQNRFL